MIARAAAGAAVFAAASFCLLVEDDASRTHPYRRLAIERVKGYDGQLAVVDVSHVRQVGAVQRRRLLERDGDVVLGAAPGTRAGFVGQRILNGVGQSYCGAGAEALVGDFVSGCGVGHRNHLRSCSRVKGG
ncbi:hypothetical protein BGO17_02740 [Candidatus Saccharibacteria bacterium 49-20]|nr:MAG: hypothetical protein BGO17_02740 [Candidatus Saccharibacteria bacterium 49-20]